MLATLGLLLEGCWGHQVCPAPKTLYSCQAGKDGRLELDEKALGVP